MIDAREARSSQLLHILQRLPGQVLSSSPARVIRNIRITRESVQPWHFLPPLDWIPSAETARLKAGQEYEKCQRLLNAQPPPVEQHFDEAVQKAKQLAQPEKVAEKKPEEGK